MNIAPKYEIGQLVYFGHGDIGEHYVECPDCRGSCVWSVTTPAGDTFEVPCSTCEYERPAGRIRTYEPQGEVKTLTIGSIRIDTADDNPVQYMCIETGVGSGAIYYERDLFVDQDEAAAHAKQMAAKRAKTQNDRHNGIRHGKKHESKRKPSFEERRIRDLEKEIARLTKLVAP